MSWAQRDPAFVLSADKPLPARSFDRLRCRIPYGGGDETPIKGERQASQIATPQVVNVKEPQRA